MFSGHDLACTLKGSLLRIVFPGPCLSEQEVEVHEECVHHVRIEGQQVFDGDLRRNCTVEEMIPVGPLDVEFIIIIAMSVVLVILVASIICNRRR